MTKPYLPSRCWLRQMIFTATNWLGMLSRGLFLLSLTSMLIVVVMRYAFNSGSIALQELAIFTHAAMICLCSAYALAHNNHVRVDIIYRHCSTPRQRRINQIGTGCFLLPTCLLLLISAWPYVMQSWRILERSAETGGLAGVFLLKSFLLVLPISLILQAIAQFLCPLVSPTTRLCSATQAQAHVCKHSASATTTSNTPASSTPPSST